MANFTTNNPFMLGFDSLERILDRAAKTSESYPPYNIEQIDDTHIQIAIAVAGFAEEDLTIDVDDKQLIIKGQRQEDENTPARNYIYRGIAARQFQRSFVLADGVEVLKAKLDKGLLLIDLQQNEPEKKVKQIKITK